MFNEVHKCGTLGARHGVTVESEDVTYDEDGQRLYPVDDDIIEEASLGTEHDVKALAYSLSDDELCYLTSVLVQRAQAKVCEIVGQLDQHVPYTQFMVHAVQGSYEDLGPIEFNVDVGLGTGTIVKTRNLVESARIAAQRYVENEQLKPVKLLEAQ